jgi:hypothetical protein
MAMSLFYFGFSNLNSGTTLYESWLGAGWNVGWTFLPIIAVGTRATDVKPETVLKFPMIYAQGPANFAFSPMRLGQVRLGCAGVGRGVYGGGGLRPAFHAPAFCPLPTSARAASSL